MCWSKIATPLLIKSSSYLHSVTNKRGYQALRRVLKNRSNAAPFSIEGYKNFLFLKNDGMPKVAANYESMLKGFVNKYNKQNKEQLPNITPMQPTIPQRQKWSVWRHSQIGVFTTAVLLLDSKLCREAQRYAKYLPI